MNRIVAERLAAHAGSKSGYQGAWRGISLRAPDKAPEMTTMSRRLAGAPRDPRIDNPGLALHLPTVKPGLLLQAVPLHSAAGSRLLILRYF